LFKRFLVLAVCLIVFLSFSLIYSIPILSGYQKKVTSYFYSNSSLSVESDKIFLLPSGKTGEEITLEKDKVSVRKIISDYNAKILMTERIEEGISVYAYSDKIPFFKRVFGKKINLHIFIGKSYLKVGTPLIFGSF
jgi:hypothetical protein